MARVLTPGGVLTGIWNHYDDRVPWVDGLEKASQGNLRVLSSWQPSEVTLRSPAFPSIESAEFAHSQLRTAESMTATIGTHSGLLILPEPERAALTARILAYLRSMPDTVHGEFEMPIVTTAMRAVRAEL
jgi:hypothetical protein